MTPATPTPRAPAIDLPLERPSRIDHGAGTRRLAAFRAHLRVRLATAASFEHPPPERFGFRFDTAVNLFTVTSFFYRFYFRVVCDGIERLPTGPMMLVANHGSHVLAWDGAMIVTACLLDARRPRLVHGMGDHRLMQLPVLGNVARRIGAADGCRDVCTDLLRAGAAVLTFPEGIDALRRPFRDRYRLRAFHQGFMHVALATGCPIVPVGVVGAEEEAPLLGNPRWLARLLRTPVAPLAPTLALPLPVKYRISFGTPLRFQGDARPENVARHVMTVQDTLQRQLDRNLATRRHVFF
jgi:1-acyl-sn-glycerol-3-phosphate acyltransferase